MTVTAIARLEITLDEVEPVVQRRVAPEIAPLNFTVDGKPRQLILPATITASGQETNVATGCLGFGLIQVPVTGLPVTGIRCAGRSAARIAAIAIVGSRALFRHTATIAAPACRHRMDG